MTPSQIEEAQRLARECVKKTIKGVEYNKPNTHSKYILEGTPKTCLIVSKYYCSHILVKKISNNYLITQNLYL